MKQLVRIAFLLIFFFCFSPQWSHVFAVACPTTPSSGVTYTITVDCVFTPAMPGVDAGTGTTNTAILDVTNGAILNIDREIGTGSVKMTSGLVSIATQGISIVSLGKALYWTDADGDTYAADPAISPVVFTGGAGKLRRSQLASADSWDCLDSDNTKYADSVCYADADQDTYTSGSAQSICGTGSACNGTTWKAAANGADCNDSDALVYVLNPTNCYQDGDADTWTSTTYTANSLCANHTTCNSMTRAGPVGDGQTSFAMPAGYMKTTANPTDCCDTDANAFPGQTLYFTVARTTCGGFDYNCNGVTEEKIGDGGVSYVTCTPNSSTQSCDQSYSNAGWSSPPGPTCGNSGTYKLGGCCNPGGDCSGTAYPACGAGNLATYTYTESCR